MFPRLAKYRRGGTGGDRGKDWETAFVREHEGSRIRGEACTKKSVDIVFWVALAACQPVGAGASVAAMNQARFACQGSLVEANDEATASTG